MMKPVSRQDSLFQETGLEWKTGRERREEVSEAEINLPARYKLQEITLICVCVASEGRPGLPSPIGGLGSLYFEEEKDQSLETSFRLVPDVPLIFSSTHKANFSEKEKKFCLPTVCLPGKGPEIRVGCPFFWHSLFLKADFWDLHSGCWE